MSDPIMAALCRRWVRVPEEDSTGTRAYRPADYPVPPARGRAGIELRADGTFLDWTPGPADVPVASAPGRWAIEDPHRVRLRHAAGGIDEVHQVVVVTDHLLQLAPVARRGVSAPPDW